jgi:hypothetical protein
MARRSSSSGNTSMIVGVVAVVLIGGGIAIVMGGGDPAPRRRTTTPAPAPQPAPTPSPVSYKPKPPADPAMQAQMFTAECKRQARSGDPDGALQKLQGALGRWGGRYDAEIYFTMAIAVGQKGGGADIWRKKYEYYKKCKDLLNAGGSFAYDPLGNRKTNLDTSMKVAKDKAGL